MSEDASPTGGQRVPPNAEGASDQNSSIIEKVRSRVTSIIPFSKWFSPTASVSQSPSGDDGSRNGGIRRRRDETVIRERTDDQTRQDPEDSEIEDADDDEVDRAPPAKRSRLNVYEVHSPMGSFVSSHKNTSNSFLSSTPTAFGVNRRKQLNIKSVYQPLRSTVSGNTSKTVKSSTIITRSIADFHSEHPDDDDGDPDILEVIPEHRGEIYSLTEKWERSKTSSSNVGGRELKLPARRPSLHGARGNGPTMSAASTRYSSTLANSYYRNRDEDEPQYEAQRDEEGDDEKKSEIITNGGRGSPNMLSVDTASESGESQTSVIQKTKAADRFYGAGVKRFRNSVASGINYASHLQGKKSLFGDKNMPSHLNNSTTSLTSLNRRQSFNASLYGSTSALSDSRLLNINSPFYKGCTTYGGASAYSKHVNNSRRVNASAPFVRPSSSLSTTSSASHATDSSAISNTAKRILELMNQFTTPLSDAKKMASNIKIPALTAHRQRFGDADRTINRGIRMTTPTTPYSRPSKAQSSESARQAGPPLNELQVPSMSQLLQMKKLHSSTERAREITRMNQSKCLAQIQPENEKQEYKLPPTHDTSNDANSSSKHVNKIKNKLTSTRSSSKATNNDAPVQPPDLPDIPLPLKDSAVPKINIDITKSTPKIASQGEPNMGSVVDRTSAKSNTKSLIQATENKSSVHVPPKSGCWFGDAFNKKTAGSFVPETKKEEIISNGGFEFVFQSPIHVTSPSTLTTKEHIATINNFKFSDPTPVGAASKPQTPVNNFSFQKSDIASKPKSACLEDSQKSAGSVPAVADQLKTTGSVMDVFKKPMAAEATSTIVSSSSSSAGFGSQFKMTSDKWECSVCLVRNENTADKCVSCLSAKTSAEPAKPALEITTKPLEPLKSSFGDKFKPSSDTWECTICMIRNKVDLKQCEACNTPKPGGTQSTISPLVSSSSSSSSSLVPNISSDSGFKSIVAEQTAKWECTACMTRNEPARTKCACCEQVKPGLVSDNVPQFSFGSSASTKFSFGFFNNKEDELKNESSSKKSSSAASIGEVKQSVSFGTISTLPPATSAVTSASFSFGIKPTEATATIVTTNATKGDEPGKPSTPKFVFGSSPQSTKADTGKAAETNETETTTSKSTIKFGTPISTSAFSPSTFSITPTKSADEAKSSSTPSSVGSSIFKPIGSMAFGASTEKKSDVSKPTDFSLGNSTSKSEGTAASKPITATTGKSGFSLLSAASQQKDQSSSADSSSTGAKLFTFGTPSTQAAAAVDKNTSAGVKTSEFKFGSTSAVPAQQKLDATTTASTTTTSSFVFGKPSTNASVTPMFGAISSNVITSSNTSGPVSTSAPSFGATPTSGTLSTASTFQPVVTQTVVSTPTFGTNSNTTKPSLFGTSTFSSASSSNPGTESKPGNNIFQFGAAGKPSETTTTTTTSATIFGNVSSTTSARFSFGSSTAATAGGSVQPAPFVFGSAASIEKPKEPVTGSGLFGSAAVPPQNSGTGSSISGFGAFSSPIQQQQSLQSVQPSPFGQAATVASPFGSNLPGNTPTFGAAAATATGAFGSTNSTFGASGTSAFGSPAAKSLFGNGFGSTTPAAQSGDSETKKQAMGFNFGAAAQNTAGRFSFNSNNVNNNNNNDKQAFAFSASSSPSFNFTGNPEGNTHSRVVTISNHASEGKTGNATNATAVGHPHKIMRWLKARNSNNSIRTTTTMTRTTLIESDQNDGAASTSINNSHEKFSTSRQNNQKSNINDSDNTDKDTNDLQIVKNIKRKEMPANEYNTYKLDTQTFETTPTKGRYVPFNVATIDRKATNANASTTSVHTAPDNSALISELTNSTENTTRTSTPTPRKLLISLRSRKLFTLNKQPKPTVSKATTQRKLFYINRVRAQKNGAFRDKSRYKLIRREAVSSGGQDNNDSNRSAEHEQQKLAAMHSTSSPILVQSNLNTKPVKSGPFFRGRNLKFVRRKYNPSKFKYVKPAD